MSHPNVVVVVMDTARATAVERLLSSGNGPFTDLADAGTRFTDAVAAAPWTLPSHASLFTGTYPSKHGAHAGHKRLEGALTTLPEVFARNGYETVAVSNNTWISEEFGFGRGFETFHKTWQYVQSDTDLGPVARTNEGLDKLRGLAAELATGNPLVNLVNAFYGRFLRKQDDDGARRTNRWVRRWLDGRDDSRPFFLFVNYLEPHLEYRPPESTARDLLPPGVSYEEAMALPQDAWGYIAGDVELGESEFEALRALYRAEIAYLSERIADLRAAVTAAAGRDTLLVVTSDHGENVGEHGLMDHQYSLHDTLLRVPLFVVGPGFEAGAVRDDIVQLVDLPDTLLDAAGIAALAFDQQTQGRSFHPETADAGREFAVAEYVAPQPSMDVLERRVGTLSPAVREYDRGLRAVRTADHKYVRGTDGSTALYDLRDDPGETDDVAEAAPETVARLDDRLDEWLDGFDPADHAGDVRMSRDAKRRLEDLGYLQ